MSLLIPRPGAVRHRRLRYSSQTLLLEELFSTVDQFILNSLVKQHCPNDKMYLAGKRNTAGVRAGRAREALLSYLFS